MPRSHVRFWLGLSLLVSLLYCLPALQQAFGNAYVVQDDARQHVTWMLRFVDPDLFPNDLHADYFQAVAPWGYTTFYWVFAKLGISPLLLSKLLPPVLALATTALCFVTVLEILPIPFAGFLASCLLNQGFWMRDDIVSATPVAFVYPFFFAFLYFLLRRQLLPMLGIVALQGLFYPQVLFVYCGILLVRLVRFEGWRPELTRDRWNYRMAIAGLSVAFLVLLPYALRNHGFGPTVTAAESLQMPTFWEPNWSEFYVSKQFDHFIHYWLYGKRAGLFPGDWCTVDYGPLTWLRPEDSDPQTPTVPLSRVRFGLPQVIFGLLLPVLLRFPGRFPLAKRVNGNAHVFMQVIGASVGLFILAHWVRFKLHLPNRHTEHSFRVVAVIAAGIALTLIFDALLRWTQAARVRLVPLALLSSLTLVLLGYPLFLRINENDYPVTDYVIGTAEPALYEFFEQQPKEIQIASIAPEMNNLPSFTRRSLIVGGKGYAIPYHLGYYNEVVGRSIALIQAQYTPSLDVLKQYIQGSQVDFWLLQRNAFRPGYFQINPSLVEYADSLGDLPTQIKDGVVPALSRVPKRCVSYEDQTYQVIDANCVLTLKRLRGGA
ncbi:MAG: hypothetical protein Fur0046_27870 [Cyanobacteria bacterium J069]|nr:MAG: hypothetical protein D6742_10740 [Cyanobacteria bacterium J069]